MSDLTDRAERWLNGRTWKNPPVYPSSLSDSVPLVADLLAEVKRLEEWKHLHSADLRSEMAVTEELRDARDAAEAEVKRQSEALARVAAVRDGMRSHDYMPIRAWGIEINNAMVAHVDEPLEGGDE